MAKHPGSADASTEKDLEWLRARLGTVNHLLQGMSASDFLTRIGVEGERSVLLEGITKLGTVLSIPPAAKSDIDVLADIQAEFENMCRSVYESDLIVTTLPRRLWDDLPDRRKDHWRLAVRTGIMAALADPDKWGWAMHVAGRAAKINTDAKEIP